MNDNGNGKRPSKSGGKQGGNPPEEYRWKPGQSGNPGGRPKGRSLTATLRRLMDKAVGDDKTMLDLLAEECVKRAAKGDVRFFQEVFDRLDPKVKKGEMELTADVNVTDTEKKKERDNRLRRFLVPDEPADN